MNRYSNTQSLFGELLKKTFRLHYLTLKHTILCILVITVVKYIAAYFNVFTHNLVVDFTVDMIAMFAIVYFFACALSATHAAFTDQPQSFIESIKLTWKNGINIFGTYVCYFIGFWIVYWFTQLIAYAIGRIFHEPTVLHGLSLFLIAVVTLMYVAMFCFSYPLAVLEKKPIYQHFYDSILLSEKQRFGILILFIILSVIFFLVTPNSAQEYFLTSYHLEGVFDFVVLCVLMPLFVNLLLFLIADAKIQVAAEE